MTVNSVCDYINKTQSTCSVVCCWSDQTERCSPDASGLTLSSELDLTLPWYGASAGESPGWTCCHSEHRVEIWGFNFLNQLKTSRLDVNWAQLTSAAVKHRAAGAGDVVQVHMANYLPLHISTVCQSFFTSATCSSSWQLLFSVVCTENGNIHPVGTSISVTLPWSGLYLSGCPPSCEK